MKVRRHHFILAAIVAAVMAGMWPIVVDLVPRLAVSRRLASALTPNRARDVRVLPHRRPQPRLPSLDPVTAWLNARPLGRDSLAGRPVVLATFTDTDPRSSVLLYALEAWHRAYANRGLRVIGVHHPEFSFAESAAVPERFVKRVGITFPIALDPGREIAIDSPSADVLSVPAPGELTFAVANARDSIVFFSAVAESLEFARAELRIRRELGLLGPQIVYPLERVLLSRNKSGPFARRRVRLDVHAGGPLASAERGTPHTFAAPSRSREECAPLVPYPVGRWTPISDGITAARGGAANFVVIRYATDRHVGEHVGVIASPPRSGAARLWIRRDGRWLPANALGEDARRDRRGRSSVNVTEPRLYIVARGSGSHVLELSPGSPGLTLHAVTFENFTAPARPLALRQARYGISGSATE